MDPHFGQRSSTQLGLAIERLDRLSARGQKYESREDAKYYFGWVYAAS